MTGENKIGWQQIVILKRAHDNPGQSSNQICKGLKITNYPDKRLEERGYLENKPKMVGRVRHNCWFITEKGQNALDDRVNLLPEINEILRSKGVVW